jgi:hypothetical protein
MSVIAGAAVLVGMLTAGPAAPSPTPAPGRSCQEVCTMIYDPVTCHFDDGKPRSFGNRCTAGAYACRYGLRIVGCGPRRH